MVTVAHLSSKRQQPPSLYRMKQPKSTARTRPRYSSSPSSLQRDAEISLLPYLDEEDKKRALQEIKNIKAQIKDLDKELGELAAKKQKPSEVVNLMVEGGSNKKSKYSPSAAAASVTSLSSLSESSRSNQQRREAIEEDILDEDEPDAI